MYNSAQTPTEVSTSEVLSPAPLSAHIFAAFVFLYVSYCPSFEMTGLIQFYDIDFFIRDRCTSDHV